jgi:putative redox protein
MSKISKTEYQGDLRTIATHLRSNKQVVTDAPIDNNGKGEAFSPTDLVATALSSCMITLMGIAANSNNFLLGGVNAEIEKIMGSNPRRISEIKINLAIADEGYTGLQKEIIERAALNCPVAKSLSEALTQTISFEYVKV